MTEHDAASEEQLKRQLSHYLRALWGGDFRVRFVRGTPLLRGAFDGREQVLPPLVGGAARLVRARASHGAAHARFSGERFDPGALKPVQRVLVSLFEDARVEALAIAHYPGLRAVWAPFHVASPSHGAPLPMLLARLSRALFDPCYEDADAWVQKGRGLFWDDRASLQSPALSRRLGSLLGNDLGQMRLSLDVRQYVVEPLYRDDHSGLWQEPPTLARAAPVCDPESAREAAPPQASAEHRYPEWDYVIERERPDFCELSDTLAPSALCSDAALGSSGAARPLQRRLRRAHLVRSWQRRCAEGPELDLAAAVDAAAFHRAECAATPRIYRRPKLRPRRSSTLLLLDLSESSNERLASGLSGSQLFATLARLLCVAFDSLVGAELAVHGFQSYGRRDVRYARFKDFGETTQVALPRLARPSAAGSTRLGPALRHAVAELRSRPSAAKVLLVLTDGDPADIDVYDDRYLVEDAHRAVRAGARAGIRVFACCLPGGPSRSRERVFGKRQSTLGELASLPQLIERAFADLAGGQR